MKDKVILALSLIAISSSGLLADAKPKSEDQIKFRQSGMMVMRWNMGVIKSQVSNPQQYNPQQVAAAANVIAALANAGMGELFNPQTATGKGWQDTRVKAAYFSHPDEVKKLSTAFNTQANQLVKLAGGGDVKMIKAQFGKLLDACKACHKKFRHKD